MKIHLIHKDELQNETIFNVKCFDFDCTKSKRILWIAFDNGIKNKKFDLNEPSSDYQQDSNIICISVES